MTEESAVYKSVGGDGPFFELVEAFYQGVENDAVLRPMYPAELAPARQHLAWFLIQRFGGPETYSSQRGHPRLRMRHLPFVVDQAARDAWMRHMRHALEAVPAFAPFQPLLLQYFEDTATFLRNHP